MLARQSWHRFTAATLTDAGALRAELARIRATGHAFDREEHEPGIHCIAMPVLTPMGRMLGAVSVTSTTGRGRLEDMERHLPHLGQAVDRIAGDMRDWRFPDQREG